MSVWKKASAVFQGGTQQIKSFKGKRVKVISSLSGINIYDSISHIPKTTSLKSGSIGFISNPHPQQMADLLIVFPKSANKIIRDLDSLTRSGDFIVVHINSPTFKQQFEIEC
jgi:ABC-type uncharacterized transport system ATPase subunit